MNAPVRRESLLGYPVVAEPLEQCLARIAGWVEEGRGPRYFACANPHSLEVARTDAVFRSALLEADLLVPDGVGILAASRILGGTIRQRITGTDVFEGVSRILQQRGGRSCFFLGSTDAALGRIRATMARRFPGVAVAGTYAPPFAEEFGDAESRDMIDAVNAAGPDVLWVGMTAPKQEKWVWKHRASLRAPFVGPIGMVFDVLSGDFSRPPPWLTDHGLEWLARFAKKPGKLWKRNLVSNPTFLLRVLRQRLRG